MPMRVRVHAASLAALTAIVAVACVLACAAASGGRSNAASIRAPAAPASVKAGAHPAPASHTGDVASGGDGVTRAATTHDGPEPAAASLLRGCALVAASLAAVWATMIACRVRAASAGGHWPGAAGVAMRAFGWAPTNPALTGAHGQAAARHMQRRGVLAALGRAAVTCTRASLLAVASAASRAAAALDKPLAVLDAPPGAVGASSGGRRGGLGSQATRRYSSEGWRRYGRRMVPLPPRYTRPQKSGGRLLGAVDGSCSTGAGATSDGRSTGGKFPSSGRRLSVVQFNILAAKLALPRHFPFAGASSIDWPHRRTTLLRNVADLDADIMCFQELDHYWVWFRPQLRKLGYASVYLKRPSVHKSSWSGVHKADGCGIFFRDSLWEAVAVDAVNFSDVHDRVGLVVMLRSRLDDRRPVLVATTHLYWNKEKLRTQLAQLKQLDVAARAMVARCFAPGGLLDGSGHSPATLPVLVCGDFNNLPSSPVYRYMMDAFMRQEHGAVPTDAPSGSDAPAACFRSAYGQYQAAVRGAEALDWTAESRGEGEPSFSTVTHRRSCTIDYIFHNQLLRPTAVLSEPPLAKLKCDMPIPSSRAGDTAAAPSAITLVAHAIPNATFGSDHLPIMATFELA